MSNARNTHDRQPHGFADRRHAAADRHAADRYAGHRAATATATAASAAASADAAAAAATARDEPAARDVARRLDRLDERIWAAARRTDDPQLAVQAAREFANEVFLGVVVGAGTGRHRLNCSVSLGRETESTPDGMPMIVMAEALAIALPADRSDNVVCELVALAHVTDAPAVVVLRSAAVDGPDVDLADDFTVRGWRIAARRCEPLDAAGMFAASCSEAIQPLPIHPGTHYEDAYPLVRLPQLDDDDDGNLVTV